MSLTSWYRGIRFMKDFTCQYLNYIFMANKKGSLIFYDGTRKIEFSRTPEAIKRASWDARVLPAVLVGKVSGGLPYVTFSKDLLDTATATDPTQTYRHGGDFDITLSLSIRATTIEERDNLTDIVGIYLAHPDCKDYYLRNGIRLPEGPKLGTESDIKETQIDHPIYATEMSMRMMSRWQEQTDLEDRLIDIIVDIEAEYTIDYNSGRVTII